MCLDIKKTDKIKFTWFKPITVYKIVINDEKGLRTVFRDSNIKIGGRYFSLLQRSNYMSVNKAGVYRGLHSFCNLDETIKERNELNPYYNYSIIECRVPRFTWYYQGDFRGLSSIASSSLKYIKAVE